MNFDFFNHLYFLDIFVKLFIEIFLTFFYISVKSKYCLYLLIFLVLVHQIKLQLYY